jgi:hypothetical protein
MSTATGYAKKVIEALYENGDPVSIDAAELLERLTENAEPEAEPVAWGYPNTAITGRNQALMIVNLEIPSNDQYPQLWVPLYLSPPRPEPEVEPVYQIAMAEGSTSTAWIDVAKDVFDDAGMYPEYKRRALYTRPEPARKPLSDEEIADEFGVPKNGTHFIEGVFAGIRYAEKHHAVARDQDA